MLTEVPALSRASVDRAAALRTDPEALTNAELDPATRVLLVDGGHARVQAGEAMALHWVAPSEAVHDGITALLGQDENGVVYLARLGAAAARESAAELVPAEGPGPTAERWLGLRDIGAALDDADAGLLTVAVALENWHRSHGYCPRCGGATEVTKAGWSRHCLACDSEVFPRTDPAVIALVVFGEGEDERALLGRRVDWPESFMSTLAGFVEAGESSEAALIREIEEEAGVHLDPAGMVYLGSQPWPFPCSLMLGYIARALTDDIEVDGEEIVEARWFTRAEMYSACAAGQLRLPPTVSIARRLVEHWYGGPLPADWSRP